MLVNSGDTSKVLKLEEPVLYSSSAQKAVRQINLLARLRENSSALFKAIEN